jgi:hypothetical protein
MGNGPRVSDRVEPLSFADVSVQAWFSGDQVAVDPGESLTAPLTIHNSGDAVDDFTIVPAGPTAGWVNLATTHLTIAAGSQEIIEVEITPPPLPSTTAGPTTVAVRIIPTSDPIDDIVVDTTVLVQTFEQRAILPLQPVQRARRRATYEFMVENHGNGLASCRLLLHDTSGRVDGTFDPPAVGIAPGGASLVRLKVKAKRGAFRRSTRRLEFDVEAQQQGIEPASATLSLVQPPTVPGAVIGRVLTVVALLAAATLAWFAVVEPAIQDAADQAVDDRIAEVAPVDDETPSPTAPVTAAPTEQNPVPEVVAPEGEPTFFRLSVDAPLTQTVDDTRTIPEGQLFDMTDVRIENPFNDGGVATLLVNGEAVFIWSLQNVRGQYFEPRITQVRLQPGDNLTFAVRCDVISDALRSTCTNAINIGGTTIPVDEV